MFVLKRREEFAAAHYLPGYEGDCAQMHGHNFIVEIEVAGIELDAQGMVIDFREMKLALQAVLPDHRLLNDWMQEPPSVENVAREICRRLHAELMPCTTVTVWENARNSASYIPPMDLVETVKSLRAKALKQEKANG